MPNDAVIMPSGNVKGPLIEVDLTKTLGGQPPSGGEQPTAPPGFVGDNVVRGPTFPMWLVAAVVVVAAVFMLKRKKPTE